MAAIDERTDSIQSLIANFCTTALDTEFRGLCWVAVEELAQKRRNLLLRGRPEQWAAAVVYAIGTANGCFGKNSRYTIKADDICTYFGLKKGNFAFKAAEIRSVLRINAYNTRFLFEANQVANPEFESVILDGKKVPITSLPDEARAFIESRRAEGWDVVLVS